MAGFFDTPLRSPDPNAPMAPPADLPNGVPEVPVDQIDTTGIAAVDENGMPLDEGSAMELAAEPEKDIASAPFEANLAEYMDEADLGELASGLMADFDTDENARKEWYKTYNDGLDLLGMKIEDRTKPWNGACGVYHPMLLEAVIRFQANTIMEIFPNAGPVKTKIMGKQTPDRLMQASRVQEEMNYFTTEKMTEYRSETETLLFHLATAGSAFRKVYFDPTMNRPAAMFVPAEDFVVPYGASDLATAPRYTHIMKKFKNEVVKLQAAGFYRDIELTEPISSYTSTENKEQELTGEGPDYQTENRYVLLEMHVDCDIPGLENPDGIMLPYVITLERGSGKVLSIRRNWREGDPTYTKIVHFAHYKYLPGMGFYGLGLIHVMGGIAKSSTSILRQLVDAGTLSNLPAGLKTRGLRIKNDSAPLEPGEFRDVDISIGSSIKDNITFLPYKEPSSVLYQLLGNMVEEGRRIGSTAEMAIADVSSQTPVGTILALIERSMKVMSAVHARVHAALAYEFRILAGIIAEMGGEYEYEPDQPAQRMADFKDTRISIIPVSDPNATTMAQRVIQYQAAMQMAQQAPDVFNMPQLAQGAMQTLQIKDADKLVNMPQEAKPADPVTENMAILNNQPVKAGLEQDHEAHIKVHMAFRNDPMIQQTVGQSPKAQMVLSAMDAHLAEHIALAYRRKIEEKLGVPLPDLGEPLPPDVENDIARLTAQAADKLLADNQNMAKQQKIEEQMQDPIIQAQIKELEIKDKALQHKVAKDAEDAALRRERLTLDRQKAGSQEDLKVVEIVANALGDQMAHQNELEKIALQAAQQAAKPGLNTKKD